MCVSCIWPLLCWSMFLLCPICRVFLSWKDVVFCQMLFLHLLRWLWYLSFILLVWYVTFIDLYMLNHSCIPGINPTWSWCIIILMCSWIQFANILLGIFTSIFTRDIGLQFSFFVVSLSGFDITVMLASWNEFGSIPFCLIFWKSLRRIGVNSSENVQ